MVETGILDAGLYVPAFRLMRRAVAGMHAWSHPNLKNMTRGARSFCNWDEDSVTMAVAAGRRCIGDVTGEMIDRLVFASTSAPFEDRANSALIGEALGLQPDMSTVEAAGSLRAGTSALKEALENTRRTSLLLAADRRPTKPASVQELKYGDGAVALVVGSGPVLARYLGGASLSVDLVDHYRTSASETDYVVEERWLRDEGLTKILPRVITAALDDAGVAADDIDLVVVPLALRMIARALKAAGLDGVVQADTLFEDIGDTGAAHALLMLAHALPQTRPGQKILLLGFGQGADGLVFEVTDRIEKFKAANVDPGPRVEEENYLKFLSFNGHVKLDWGIRAERDNRTALSTFYRKRKAVTGFIGGRCAECGTPQFPKSRVCVDCGAVDRQEDYSFRNSVGRIKTFTEDWQAYTPAPPLAYGNIAFEEGGNLFMELTDCEPGSFEVGQSLRMVFRIKDFDEKRGFRRYFWKAVAAGKAD